MDRYLFELNLDFEIYVSNEPMFKDALCDLSRYRGGDFNMMKKCLYGFDNSDIAGMIAFYNKVNYTPIIKVYIIKDCIYES